MRRRVGRAGSLLALLTTLRVASSEGPPAPGAAPTSYRRPEDLSLHRRGRLLMGDGFTECTGCVAAGNVCAGTTMADSSCTACGTGQTWWPCNIVAECYCKSEAVITDSPTESPVTESPVISTLAPTVASITDSSTEEAAGEEAASTSSSAGGSSMAGGMGGGSFGGGMGGSNGGGRAPGNANGAGRSGGMDPVVLEGMYVMDAHLSANKITLSRELFAPVIPESVFNSGDGKRKRKRGNVFTYQHFRSALHKMIVTPVGNHTFYIGDEDERAYGLVNIAAFLSQAVEESIIHGSCDEVNSDAVQGGLPASNACGQNGLEYQNMTCEKYACEVDETMRTRAEGRGAGPAFYCGPRGSDYGDFSGSWDYVSGREVKGEAFENKAGRTDVEGCCWWGRGAIQLRGTCSYGKLNYFLGKRAHDEGRPAMFPDVDFCRNPQAVCSDGVHPDLKWIVGMFRWVTDVQPWYGTTADGSQWSYRQRLAAFVNGGLNDPSFIHGVSGVVAQGCPSPPCPGHGEFDGAARKATFVKTLKALGLRPRESQASSYG